jgi:uncharacterized protein
MNDIPFKKIAIQDKEAIEFYLFKYSSFCLSAFTFSSLVAWERVYHYQWAIVKDTLLLKFVTIDDGKEQLMQPIGEFPKLLQDQIIQYARSLNYRLTIYGVSNAFISKHPVFVAHFERTEHRDMDNYIYSAEDLATLKGGNFQAKRNLITQFETNNKWASEAVSIENISACFEVIGKIYDQNNLDAASYLAHELKALEFVLNNFTQFKDEGVLIRVDGKPVAFSLYEHLNPSTCVVHFEKAIRDYKGLYQLINRETAKKIYSKGCKHINREEDLGIEGLRKAKLSYHPIELCPAHALVYKK